jgi:hypothetical protein
MQKWDVAEGFKRGAALFIGESERAAGAWSWSSGLTAAVQGAQGVAQTHRPRMQQPVRQKQTCQPHKTPLAPVPHPAACWPCCCSQLAALPLTQTHTCNPTLLLLPAGVREAV